MFVDKSIEKESSIGSLPKSEAMAVLGMGLVGFMFILLIDSIFSIYATIPTILWIVVVVFIWRYVTAMNKKKYPKYLISQISYVLQPKTLTVKCWNLYVKESLDQEKGN